MRTLSRRDFLKLTGIGAAAAMLSACGGNTETGSDTSGNPGTGTSTNNNPSTPSTPTTQTVESLGTTATEGTAATAEEGDDQEIVVCIKQDPAPLSPWSGGRDVRVYILNQCYQPLFRFDGYGGDLVSCLGKEYKRIDAQTLQVELFDNIYDSAGNHITASDVAFSFKTALELGNYSRISDVDHVDVVSDYVVNIIYGTSVDIVGVLDNSLTEIYMVSEKAYTASADALATATCGTGRYVMTKYVEGASVTVEKRDDYWEQDDAKVGKYDKANVGTLRYDVITDAAARAIGLQRGEIQYCAFLDANDYQLFEDGGESDKDFDILASKTPYLYTYTFNCAPDSLFGDEDLRRAFCHAVDCDAVGLKAFGAAALPVRGSGSTSYVGYQEEWNDPNYYDGHSYYEYDPELAKQYLQKYLDRTGKKASDINIRIYVGMMGGMDTMATLAQAYLSAIGVSAEAQVYDSATLNALKKDTTAWEVSAYTGYANKYITENWDLNFDARDYSWGGTMTYAYDDVLQEKLEKVLQTENFTPENLTDFNNYIYEKAYFLPVCGQIQRLVYPSYCVDCVVDGRGIPMPGASSYDWSLRG